MAYRKSDTADELYNALEELYLNSRTAVQVTTDCNWITYNLDPKGEAYGVSPYQCPTKTLVAGYCVLAWSDAVSLCNSEANCGGLLFTTKSDWHNKYDTNSESSVLVYSASAGIRDAADGHDWFIFPKKCWQFKA